MATYIVNSTEEQEKALDAFLMALEMSFIKGDNDKELPKHVVAGIVKEKKILGQVGIRHLKR